MRTPILAGLAGIIVGSAVAVALVAGGALRVPVQRDWSDASADFLTAWERSRTGTFVVESEFRRTLADGRTLFSSSQLVQRPPDRILRQFGGIDGQIGGHPVICSTDQSDNFTCMTGSMGVPPFDEALRAQVDTFRSYFTTPDPPLYRVIHAPEDGCYELIQQIVYPDPTYGKYARFCFDPATGAMTTLERHLEGGVVEILEAFAVRTEVTGNDFSLDQDDDFDLRMDLGSAGLDPSLGTAPPGTDAPAPAVDDPTTAPSPEVGDLELLDTEDLVLAGSEAVRQGRAPDPYVTVLAQRIESGEFSINDTLWRRADGRVEGLAEPMVLDLLRRGYAAPVP